MEAVDVLVVGAGPAGCCAAGAAAAAGASVLLVEQRRNVGLPVQCAEYVPAQIVSHTTIPKRAVAQRVRTLHTHLPDGEVTQTRAGGYILDRSVFDKSLAATAYRAGARIWMRSRALKRTEDGALIRRNARPLEVKCRVIIGADGPRSTVGRWMRQSNTDSVDARQVEVVLAKRQDHTDVYFDPQYVGGYGWCFPKGDTANVGVGVNRALGGEPASALAHLLDRLEIPTGAVVGRTAGMIPCGGSVSGLVRGNLMLAGDAAGLTHPVTGAGILSAIVSGTLAGHAAASAALADDVSRLTGYAEELDACLGGPLRHAVRKRRELDEGWTDDPHALSGAIRRTWIAFKRYSRR
jgi:geranylgeranyl reductase family protein